MIRFLPVVLVLVAACATASPQGGQMVEDPSGRMVLETMPEPIGGISGLQDRLRYPDSAWDANLEGAVRLQFLVTEEGTVQDIRVQKSLSPDCDAEAIRLMSSTRFKPGMREGKPVAVKMSVPVTFRIRR
jgi:protein TonB